MTSSSSPGSLLYAGKEVVEICDGVLRGLRVRLVRLAVVAAGVTVPLMVPASCSAVISLVP